MNINVSTSPVTDKELAAKDSLVSEDVPTKNMGQDKRKYSNEMFKVKTLEDLIADPRNTAYIKQAFGYWAYENETIVIGGTTNCGKSIFAFDIAVAVATGMTHWANFRNEVSCKALLIDSEMNDHQYVHRCMNLETFGNILRASFWKNEYHGDEMEEMIDSIREIIESPEGPRFIIIDNISTLSALVSPTQVLKLLAMLEAMKQDYGCTLVIVTHTNKTSETKGLGINDFRGSKVFSNAADTIIGIGNTNEDSETKYFKLLKTRNIRIPDTVSLARISEEPYLHFEYIGEVFEEEVLPTGKKRGPSSSITEFQAQRMMDMANEGLSLRQIANNMNLGKSTVHRFLSELNAKNVSQN